MSAPVLLRRSVAERRRWLIGWTLGIVALSAVSIGFWPAFKGKTDDLNEMIEGMPDSIKSLFGMGGGVDPFSPVGYLSSQIYALMLPLLLFIAGIGAAASLAGDEEHGLMEMAYSLPISRRSVVAQRWAGVVVLTGLLAVVSFVAVWVTTLFAGLQVGVASLAWSTVGVAALTWSVSSIALAVGALTGRRSLAITVASVVGVASYLISSLADAGIGFFVHLEPFSLFTHYDVLHSLVHGTPSWSLLVLFAVALAGWGAAEWAIDRRDLRAG